MPGPPTLMVLHGLRLGSVVAHDALAARCGLSETEVAAVLVRCGEHGLVRKVEGRLSGWALTRRGRVEGERLLAAELDQAGARPLVEAAYRDFLPLNQQVLGVCTDWQVVRREGTELPNDHSDESHDLAVIGRLVELHRAAVPMLRRLSAALERFSSYEQRLGRAVERTAGGRTEWFTRPMIDSYHTVWFELHEDLLATLGRSRTDEREVAAAQLLEERA